MSKGISVVLCCFNSADRLPNTLKHLALQEVPSSITWEIIVVNNASTDNTAIAAKTEWTKYNINTPGFKIVEEHNPGLSNARDKGIQKSSYNYIVFCDDDNWLDPEYLRISFNIMDSNPSIGALGGQSVAVSDRELPSWFDSKKKNYAVGEQAERSGNVSYKKHLWGGGMVIRKEAYQQAFQNFPSILAGRNNGKLTSGEDSELCMRLIMMGYELYYSQDLKFKHFIPSERLNLVYNGRLEEGFIDAHIVLNIYNILLDLKSISFLNKANSLIKSFLRIFIVDLLKMKRWDVSLEKLNVYLLSDIYSSSVNQNVVNIKQFYNQYS